jgi:DNA-binding transcriptional ArsR family regulator
MTEAAHIVAWLRAAGEPTRLRLLALCTQREFSVSELALAVGQSGPRVSRHLKILCAAGLLSRLRSGQWVHYRLAQDPAAARFLNSLVADLDPADPTLACDRGRIRAARTPTEDAQVRLRLDRALGSFIAASAVAGRQGSTLVVGVAHQAMLAGAIRIATDCTAIAHGRRAAQAASSFVKHESLSCCIVVHPAARSDAPIDAGTLKSGPHFDAVVLDRLGAHGSSLSAWLAAARQVLLPAGRLWLFEHALAFEERKGAAYVQPLARLRQLLDEAGFACERLSPIQAGHEHILAAVAVPAWAVRAASVA